MQVHFLVTVHCNSGCYQLQSNCTYITTSWTYIRPQHSVLQPGLSSSTACLAQHAQHSMHSTACLAQHAHCSTTTLTSRSQARWQNVAARLVSQHSMRSTAQHSMRMLTSRAHARWQNVSRLHILIVVHCT